MFGEFEQQQTRLGNGPAENVRRVRREIETLALGARVHVNDRTALRRLRDEAGHWHVAMPDTLQTGDGTFLSMEVLPPLSRSSDSVEVEVTGCAGRVRCRAPASW